MKRVMAAMAAVMAVAACGVDKGTPFRDGFPTASTVKMAVPDNGKALTGPGTRQDGLEGDPATFYKFTREVTLVVNGAGLFVLNLVERIAESPPTSVTGSVAVWGPHTDPLSPNTWRFTVTKNGDHDYSYLLEGRGKTEPDSKFRVILSGNHVSAGKNLGHGAFLVDWEKAKELPENDGNVGLAEYTYTRDSATTPVDVTAHFTQVMDKETQTRVNAAYTYTATPGNGGSFSFTMAKNFVTTTAAFETLSIFSRWQETGAGRSDVTGVGGDISGSAHVSECWDQGFLSRYLDVSYDAKANYGAPTACAFATAQYPTP